MLKFAYTQVKLGENIMQTWTQCLLSVMLNLTNWPTFPVSRQSPACLGIANHDKPTAKTVRQNLKWSESVQMLWSCRGRKDLGVRQEYPEGPDGHMTLSLDISGLRRILRIWDGANRFSVFGVTTSATRTDGRMDRRTHGQRILYNLLTFLWNGRAK